MTVLADPVSRFHRTALTLRRYTDSSKSEAFWGLEFSKSTVKLAPASDANEVREGAQSMRRIAVLKLKPGQTIRLR